MDVDSVAEDSAEAMDDESDRMFICLKCREWITGSENFAKHHKEKHPIIPDNSADAEDEHESREDEHESLEDEDESLEEAIKFKDVKEVDKSNYSDSDIVEMAEPEPGPSVVRRKGAIRKKNIKKKEQAAAKKRKFDSKQAKITDFLGTENTLPELEIKMEVIKAESTTTVDDEDRDGVLKDELVEPESLTTDTTRPSSEEADIKIFKDELESSEEEEDEKPVFITEEEYADSFRFDPEKFGFEDSILDKAFAAYVQLKRCDEVVEEECTPVKATTRVEHSVPKVKPRRGRPPNSAKVTPAVASSKKRTPMKERPNPIRVPDLNKPDDQGAEDSQDTPRSSFQRRKSARRT